jgi:hypothetical protein
MKAVVDPLFDMTSFVLDDFYVNGFDSNAFLLMLYDTNRIPFSQRINRLAFVDFIKESLKNFPVTGSFESYLFVLGAVFGSSDFLFTVPAPGKLSIDVLAISNADFDFIGREFIDGAYEFFEMIDYDNKILGFRGVPGIDTEYALNLLFSEIMPAGIYPDISLNFISKFEFIGYDGSGIYDMIDSLGNQIIFVEVGG